ncbi:unnamed protein product [marine sediment metagenome]|uniref:Uncharacterized protein n=1 Tax=marine sediment metagenome TaxID=412755 RepID=X1AQL3_9ZZZZ
MNGGLRNPTPVDDTPVNGNTSHASSSNWAFDHNADADAHHSEEIPDGRAVGGGVTYLTIPGVIGLGSTTATGLLAANKYYHPIYVRTPITVDAIVVEITANGGPGSTARAGIYHADVNWQPGALISIIVSPLMSSIGVPSDLSACAPCETIPCKAIHCTGVKLISI